MELHSYAKRRTSKKWNIEQKRKLVEARIAYDAWFTNKPSSVVPWKNILIAADLSDFNVFFVRKQWSNMLERYKQYKRTRLGNSATKAIDAEQIKSISQEWEFFEPIHKFMTRKTTSLHSYALTHRTDSTNSELQGAKEKLLQTASSTCEDDGQTNKTITRLQNETININYQKDCTKDNLPNNTTIVIQPNIPQEEGINLFSSDTNEEFQIVANATRVIGGSQNDAEDENIKIFRNTDHDFYSKKSFLGDIAANVNYREEDLQEQQSNYFADASEESQASMNMVVNLIQSCQAQSTSVPSQNVITVRNYKGETIEIKSENITQTEASDLKGEGHNKEILKDAPVSAAQSNPTQSIESLPTSSSTTTALSERDKYYRHKRRFNRRLEKRLDAVLQVVGQIVKVEYPYVDVSPLVGIVTAVTSNVANILSSDSEDDNQQKDTADISKTKNVNM